MASSCVHPIPLEYLVVQTDIGQSLGGSDYPCRFDRKSAFDNGV